MNFKKTTKALALSTLALLGTLGGQSFTTLATSTGAEVDYGAPADTTFSAFKDAGLAYIKTNGGATWGFDSSVLANVKPATTDLVAFTIAEPTAVMGSFFTTYSDLINLSATTVDYDEITTYTNSEIYIIKGADVSGISSFFITASTGTTGYEHASGGKAHFFYQIYSDPNVVHDGGKQDIYTNIDSPLSYDKIKASAKARDLFGVDVPINWPSAEDLTYDPNKLGTYDIPITATDSYGQTGHATVVVHVVDTTAPTIALASNANLNFDNASNNKLAIKDLPDKFSISDNATSKGGTIEAPTFKLDGVALTDDKTFNSSDVRTHTLSVSVKDSSGNSTSKDFNLIVADKVAPVVAFKSADSTSIIAGVSATFSETFAKDAILSLLKATDDVDGDVSTTLTASLPTDFNKVGTHSVVVSAKDKAGNVGKLTVSVEVNSDIPPVFVFDKSLVLTSPTNPISESNLESVISQAYKGIVDIQSINIDSTTFKKYSDNSQKAGVYPVKFTITAKDNTIVNDSIDVKVLASNSNWFKETWEKIVAFHKANPWIYAVEAVAGLLIISLIIWGATRKKH